MQKEKRDLLRKLSMISGGAGIVLTMMWAGTSDFRDELQYADKETREYHESKMISQEAEAVLATSALLALSGGAIGLTIANSNNKKR